MKKFFQNIRNWYSRLSPQAKPGIISIALVIVIIIIAAIALLVSGCDFVNQAIESAADSALASVSEEGNKVIASVSEEGESVIASVSDEVTPSVTAWPSYGVGEFDLAEAWASEGDVVILNDNIPYFSENEKKSRYHGRHVRPDPYRSSDPRLFRQARSRSLSEEGRLYLQSVSL